MPCADAPLQAAAAALAAGLTKQAAADAAQISYRTFQDWENCPERGPVLRAAELQAERGATALVINDVRGAQFWLERRRWRDYRRQDAPVQVNVDAAPVQVNVDARTLHIDYSALTTEELVQYRALTAKAVSAGPVIDSTATELPP